MPLPYNRNHKHRSRELRRRMTAAELAFWKAVRKKRLGAPFYRQKPLHQYVVDFYCPAARLVVELDGVHHREPDAAEADAIRDQTLEQFDLLVLRFSNAEVLREIDAVVAKVAAAVALRCVRPK